jgi:hypothetical protein
MQPCFNPNLGIPSLNFYLACLFSLTAQGQPYDQKLADKFGLTIRPPQDQLEPAPEWLQRADMFTHGSGIWKDYKFTLEPALMTRIVRLREANGPAQITEHYPVETIGSFDGSRVKGVALISHVPHSQKAYEEAHKQGFKVVPYVHFTDIHSFYADQDVFLFQHPEILLKDETGKWGHIPMDGSYRAFRYLTCANSPSYWKLCLDYVKKMMDWGADGVFIDNVDNRARCMAPKFNVRNPEFPPFTHDHLFPDADHNFAFDRMLQAVRALVKSYGDDKVVVLNSGIGTPFQKEGDCCVWESFIFSWAWEGRRDTWEDVKKRAKANQWYQNSGRRIAALSTITRSRKSAKDDAFWAFAAARLVDFVWWASLSGTGAETLYQAHLGKSLEPLKEINGLAYRAYENGLIVLNNSEDDQSVELTLPAAFQPQGLLELYDGSLLTPVSNNKVNVAVPKMAARIYLSPPNPR